MGAVFSRIDSSELVATLKELIKIDSVNPLLVPGGAGEAKVAVFIADFLENLGLEVDLCEVERGRPNVVGVLRGQDSGSSLILNGHMDTVGIEGMVDPFNPRVEGNRIYGRGSADMKGGLASILHAVKAVVDSEVDLRGDLIVASVVDEEYTSLGTEKLMESFKADGAVVCESTGLDIGIAHKGFVWLEVETFGKAAHGSRPKKGVDAIAKMGKFLVELEDFGSKVLSERSHSLLGSPSVHSSIIEGGRELSTYPDQCKLKLERRTIPGEDTRQVESEFLSILERLSTKDSKFNADLRTIFARGPFTVSAEENVVRLLKEAVITVLGTEPQYIGSYGWLDSEIIQNAGVPTVIFGPGGEGMHGIKEYVSVDQVVKSSMVLSQFILDFCNYVPS
ncbi:MAG: ArgE/DapE family deacylase [Candidatus Bathyarchaeota archaeon]|nr:MAG: ArgE/DapE family deacylase [Candidatus Bathyarchaeota archaeon]